MSTLFILIHGYNVKDGGKATVGTLGPYVSRLGIPYILINYGHFGVGETYRKNKKIAKKVAKACSCAKEEGKKVIVVGHSNGCAITHIAADKYGAPIDRAVYINPALDKDKKRPDSIGSIHVWYSPSDKPVKIAKLLPMHPWGEMGACGYQGVIDPNITNFNEEDYKSGEIGHSDVFRPPYLPFFGEKIIKTAFEETL